MTDASGCTDRELALLASVPVPEGASAHEPTDLFSGALRSCGLMVELPANDRDDVLGELHSALADDGWDVSDPVIDRRWNDLDVWAFVAERSPDTMLVEVYSGDGVSDHYFLTAVPLSLLATAVWLAYLYRRRRWGRWCFAGMLATLLAANGWHTLNLARLARAVLGSVGIHGGYHVMLIGVKQELKAGDTLEITLHFRDHADIAVTVPVQESQPEGMSSDH